MILYFRVIIHKSCLIKIDEYLCETSQNKCNYTVYRHPPIIAPIILSVKYFNNIIIIIIIMTEDICAIHIQCNGSPAK